jgi:putative hydrolase of the HAD superfamily
VSNKVLFIDLDDTLFEEEGYVRSGFAEVAKYVSNINGYDNSIIFNHMMYQFYKYGRTGVFNRIMSHFEFDKPSIGDMIEIYRNHKPNIRAYDGIYTSISQIKKVFDKVFIITDGIITVQKNKVYALGLENHVDGIIYCMEYNSPKPSPLSIQEYTRGITIDMTNSKMVGDDPYCDAGCAERFGIDMLRVLTGRFKNIDCEEYKVARKFQSFCEASKFLIEV